MSLATIIQFAPLAVVVVVGVCVVYLMFRMRTLSADHRDQVLRAVSAVEEFQKLQPEFVSALQRLESDGHALQRIAIQLESVVAVLKDSIGSSVIAAADRHVTVISDLRDHLDSQEARLGEILERMSENTRALQPPATPRPVARPDNVDYARLRKDVVGNDSQLRFSLLKDWISINTLAILRRASLGWNSPNDLIASVPAYFQPEAEILSGRVLPVGTRGNAKQLAIPVGNLDPSTDVSHWFDVKFDGPGCPITPAVLVRANGHFNLISKGTAAQGFQDIVTRKPS